MILTEAKKRAVQEFDQLLDTTGVSLERMRRYEAEHPSVRKATYRVLHSGVAGTAANYFLDLANRM